MSVPILDSILKQSQLETDAFIQKLRKDGYKALHPNDGWNDREKSVITLTYPDFDDGCQVGDKIMLGWANDKDSHLPVILIGVYENIFDVKNPKTKRFFYEKSS